MEYKIEKILEFEKIKLDLATFSHLEEVEEKILDMHILKTKIECEKAIEEVDRAYQNIGLKGAPPIYKISPIGDTLSHLRVLSSLSIEDIYNILKIMRTVKDLLIYHKEEMSESALNKYIEKLEIDDSLTKKIESTINDDLTISDDATAELSSIRKKLKAIQGKIEIASNRVLEKYKDKLNDNVLSIKDGKLCLQVKAEYKDKVEGIIHDISSTKTTFFIEPKEITIISNEEQELKGLETIEINKVLKELSLSLIPRVDMIKTNYENIIFLDFIYAKASYARHNKYTKPIISDNGKIDLKDAVHPLLDKEKAVPLNIKIGDGIKTLIITGPNTGGKTVALKTVGLTSIMALSGLFISASENSVISFFDNIYADIGDEQSIEQNLSTFSSHMKNIIEIVNNATERSLVLFDEICTGTDPIEGATLAMSIITYLKNKKTTILTTTHYPELKLYALSEKDVLNGSFEFDVDTLSPTYRLLLGLPGKSNAFLISEKLGLDKNIIDNAKRHVNEKDTKFEDIVSNLQAKEKNIDFEKKEIEKLKLEIEELKAKVERQQKGLNDREESIIRRAKEKADKILMDAKEVADETIKNMKKEGATLDGSVKERTKINKMLASNAEIIREKVKGPSKPLSPKKVIIGEKVKILSMGLEGTIESLPDKDYNLFVRVGLVKTKARLNDLEVIDEIHIKIDNATVRKVKSGQNNFIKIEKNMDTPMEINLIGKDRIEALLLLDKYLDDCFLARMKSCRIIHGRGTGALQAAVKDFLRKKDFIKEYRYGEYNEGGDGATIVTFT